MAERASSAGRDPGKDVVRPDIPRRPRPGGIAADPAGMIVDDPETLAEVTAAFEAYEKALLANDNETLDAMFLHSDSIVRYGVAEMQYGIDEVRQFRAQQEPFERSLSHTVITTYGRDTAIASTLFHRPDLRGQAGRQTQAWIRTADGWRVAAAHVSMVQTS